MAENKEGGAFLLGTLLAGGVAIVHNIAKDSRYRQELQQVYDQGWSDGARQQCQVDAQTIVARDTEIARLQRVLNARDVEVIRLNTVVADQAKALAGQRLQLTTPLLPPDDQGGNGTGKLS